MWTTTKPVNELPPRIRQEMRPVQTGDIHDPFTGYNYRISPKGFPRLKQFCKYAEKPILGRIDTASVPLARCYT